MKFLITTKIKDSFYALPNEIKLALAQETMAFFEKNIANGKCKEVYNVTGKKMTLGIWEAETAEELERGLTEISASYFFEYDLLLLSDFNDFMERGIEKMKRLMAK